MYMHYIFIIHSSVEDHSSCFYFLAIINRAEQISVKYYAKFFRPYAKKWYSWIVW